MSSPISFITTYRVSPRPVSIAVMPIQYLLALLSLLSFSAADPAIHPGLSDYTYKGCYNETANLPDTPGTRALLPGTSRVSPDEMSPETCLAFCASGSHTYAGLEYSRYALAFRSPTLRT